MSDAALHPAVTLRLYTDHKCFGPGVAMLLRRVRELHSLRSAAMDMDMAYSKAWTILREAERGLGFKLLHSTTGGRGGGGATPARRGGEGLAKIAPWHNWQNRKKNPSHIFNILSINKPADLCYNAKESPVAKTS